MEKRTVLFIVLSTVIFIGFYFIQSRVYPPEDREAVRNTESSEAVPVQNSAETGAVLENPVVSAGTVSGQSVVDAAGGAEAGAETAAASGDGGQAPPEEPAFEERIVVETDLIRAVFTSAGGDMVSYQLLEHNDKGENVEMILRGDVEPHAFAVAFGGIDAAPVRSFFRVTRRPEQSPSPSPRIVEFSRDFSVSGGGAFTLTKRYEFRPGEYMFELTISLDSVSQAPLNINGAAYTLGFGPQIGPRFDALDNRYEYRRYVTLNGTKQTQEKPDRIIDSRFTWAGIAGKYFTAMVVPDNTLYQLYFSTRAESGIPSASRLYMIRPALSNARTTDVYHFYLGPKNQENLGKYDTGDNSFGMRDLQFLKASNTSGFLSPLENLLKLLLQLFYRLIPNYGVAIILLTLLVKVIFFPLTKKSSEASIKMQALAPKIKELQTKYKDNPAKLNAEMGALYKKEGHNPMSGCLPLLIQMPLLFAMYNLFNTHFDLRGAMFIPQWIPDLSLPEALWTFENSLPILGWNSLRLLPFIYLGSQMLYALTTRTPEQQGNSSMAMMMYAMPIMFFFVLYNVPSGLLVFWIFSNLFTLVQQLLLNKFLAKKRAAMQAVEAEQKTVIAPKRKKKR
jgi:YidC/Oxa1 family membrane protein insertase